jgi:hypothetical protein
MAISLALLGCARHWSGPIASVPGNLLECPRGAGTESCFRARPLATPLIVAPGRILVVTRAGLSRHPGLFYEGMPGMPFVIEEITLAGHADVARGYCPYPKEMAEAAALGQLASGDIVVGCLGSALAECYGSHDADCLGSTVSLGVVDRSQGRVDWRWHITIGDVPFPPDVHVVELGGRVGVVYPNWTDMHVPEDWRLALAPDGQDTSLEEGLDEIAERDVIAVASVGDKLQILFTGTSSESGFVEVTLAANGTRSIRKGLEVGAFTAGTPSPGCVSQDIDGTVTVTRPAARYTGRPDGTVDEHRGTLTVRYPHARLSRGADAYPSPDGRCVGRGPYDDDGGPMDETWSMGAHAIRATRVGWRELVVFDTPHDNLWNATVRVERR